MALISSRGNAKIKLVRALRGVKARRESGLFIVEGIRHVGEAVESGASIEAIYYAPDLLESEFAQDLIAQQSDCGVPCYGTTADVFHSLADRENPQGILAAVRQFERRLTDLTPQDFTWGIALVAPQDPGNLGTILRTVDAVGANGTLLLDGGADPYHPGAVRASMGALFWRPLVETNFKSFTAWARAGGYTVYGTSAHGEVDFRDVEAYRKPCILLLGSERKGLTSEQATICESVLRLPMHGRATSLNLAVATGVVLYDMLGKIK